MNELFDKLIIRAIFVALICALIFAYKYAHSFLYPSSRLQLFKRFYPTQNPAQTLHLLARIIGVGIIFSNFHIYMANGIIVSILDFFVKSIATFFIYLASIYIMESIVLYNFDFSDEILKRKNYAYALISFSMSITLAIIIKTIASVSRDSLILLFFIWPFAIVIIGLASKSYSLVSKLPFNRLLIQGNLALACSYSGFLWGWTLIITSSLNNSVNNLYWYSVQVVLKILLSILIYPLFKLGLQKIYLMQDELGDANQAEINRDLSGPSIGYGIYEGALNLTASFLTTIIAGQIDFGTFYPAF
ncbi:MAG: hypothetical protein A2504_15815 [Bdellovibrionales bacterium RIFOXYD12_FULL_39_22]|nr:MAG: hypothetical protein A2385_07725 [Bdellovibrionales bacterium RIFOXYB1_FULL_39_21]OFZ43052.1 MAG: hypothetical protein A2485_11500 [Bdellovibrionales bacterium RIFOXYC12_FULL_39_17]OFZ50862.1 MAG: hypothetical protein A2404_06640 [Bdellovibrionales bacterium RIFOXYC1_FULL_39_130]OFZ75517.1 MAG: hypothetical protein A2451_10605 [Bdellovibrionales bacterium RIFOXYC2_FULL_39_8]OFZ78085.1 MAG: hypothetical protein A2560_01810 [Bdellovibrionales bacterium RIFOXYD1_FULL_39_84]OFZ93953.1 MAG: